MIAGYEAAARDSLLVDSMHVAGDGSYCNVEAAQGCSSGETNVEKLQLLLSIL